MVSLDAHSSASKGISNGCFFDLGARLARHTGNTTYSKTVVAAYDWLEKSALVNGTSGVVYDGTTVAKGNCSNIDKVEWSYVAAILNNGAAYMYNQVLTSSFNLIM